MCKMDEAPDEDADADKKEDYGDEEQNSVEVGFFYASGSTEEYLQSL